MIKVQYLGKVSLAKLVHNSKITRPWIIWESNQDFEEPHGLPASREFLYRPGAGWMHLTPGLVEVGSLLLAGRWWGIWAFFSAEIHRCFFPLVGWLIEGPYFYQKDIIVQKSRWSGPQGILCPRHRLQCRRRRLRRHRRRIVLAYTA